MPPSEELTGRTIGKCRILGRLGHGKTSTIFRAFYEPLQKEVAVKILKEDMKATAEIREKFLNEAKSLARLDHQNIVKVFDVVEDAGNLLIIMELLPGADLYRLLGEQGPFGAAKAVEIVLGAANALLHAHRAGIIHRDVKPQNLMLVGRREQVKLVDFGLATEGALQGGKAGTPHYMSPEQIQGRKVDEKSDIYSLGATFFHLLTGRPPYPGKTRDEIVAKHLAGKLPTVSRANRDMEIPPALDPVLKRMMAPVPGYRYSAADLIATLEGLNLLAKRRGRRTHSARAATQKSNSKAILVVVAVVVALAIGVLVAVLLSGGGKTPPAPPPVTGAGAGAGAGQPGKGPTSIADRGAERENREALADGAYRRAQSFEAANFGKRDAIYAEWKKVWDEFGETGSGGKAREKMREIEKQIAAEKKAAEDTAKEGSKHEQRAKLDEALKKHCAAYDFAAANKAIEDFLSSFDDRELEKAYRRIPYAAQFLRDLAKAIGDNQNKYAVKKFKDGVPASLLLDHADDKGLVLKDGTLERREPWSYFTPREMAKVASYHFASRDALSLLNLGLFLTVVGATEDGQTYIDQARVWDELGRVQQILDGIETGK
jgi:tRNA A-37 threonylcarbamoyl transferase component Bud32